jgi:hypothetical protein
MATFVLPKPKEDTDKPEPATSVSNDEWRRRITVPANEEIMRGLQIGDTAEVTLRGKITELRNNASQDSTDQTITITVTEVSAYSDASEGRMRDGMEAGYKEG